MFNIISTYNSEYGWSLIFFLRDKHRPELFFSKGEDRLLISPAAVDLGGLLIAPRERDFERINKDLIKKIFNEVSLNDNSFNSLNKIFKRKIKVVIPSVLMVFAVLTTTLQIFATFSPGIPQSHRFFQCILSQYLYPGYN